MRERFPLFRFFQRLLDRKTRKNLQITIIFCTFVGKQRNMTAREDREKEKTSRENLGKFFYDLAKANFTTNVAGCILSMVMKEKYDDAMVWGLLSFGLASTAILAYVGFRILKK